MAWRADKRTTRLATELFAGSPEVKRNGDQYLFCGTPFGRLELLRLPGGRRFLAAAEHPPTGSAAPAPASLPNEVVAHLKRNKLRPFRVLSAPSGEVAEALQQLAGGGEVEPAASWSAYLCGFEEHGGMIGESRELVVERLSGLLHAHSHGGPLPTIVGPKGIGKRAAAAAASKRQGLDPVELPLGRLLVNRVFQTPMETVVQTALAAAANMERRQLLVVSGAEIARHQPRDRRQQLSEELARLAHVLLLSETPAPVPGTIELGLPGLAGEEEARRLIAAGFPDLDVEAGPVVGMIARAAAVPRAGILPGRVLYLVRLALSLRGSEGGRARLSPDDAVPAISLATRSWTEASAGGGEP